MNAKNTSFYNTRTDKLFPDAFRIDYHVHILCHKGEMHFSTKHKEFTAKANDLVIWQMTTTVFDVTYSSDFDADFLLIGKDYLTQYNPEMLYATKGYVFIKNQPVMPLHAENLNIMREDFIQFKSRINQSDRLFQEEIIGRLLQIFLFDLWNVIEDEIDQTEIDDNATRIFIQFLFLVEEHCKTQREVQFYSEKLYIVPKYLSQICRSVSGKPASDWIESFAANELRHLLNNRDLTLTEIADEMNFSTMSFFSRYVKKVLGVTPTEYRKDKT